MNLRGYQDLLSRNIRSTISKVKELNTTKEGNYNSIIEAYKKGSNTLPSLIDETYQTILDQKKIVSRLNRGAKKFYSLIKSRVKQVSRWYSIFSGAHSFLELLGDHLIISIETMDYYIDKQIEILRKIRKKHTKIRNYKLELNHCYKEELENFYLLIALPKHRVIDNFYGELSKRLKKNESYLRKQQNPKKVEAITQKINAISFLLFSISIIKSIEFDVGWLNKIFYEVEEINNELIERDGSGIDAREIATDLVTLSRTLR